MMLSLETRKKYFKELGLGEYSGANILKLQKKYMYRKSDWDGIYGQDTDNLLRTVYNCSKVKNFAPEEFACTCKGKYCCGYPSYMKMHQLNLMQSIRDHWNKPVTVTCGLRCKKENGASVGSIDASRHLTGEATDFYQVGVTDTLANRKKALAWIKTRPNFNYGYGNGINSNGVAVKASYMGNCMHCDTKEVKATPTPTPTKAEQINTKALEYAWKVGTPEKVYKYPSGKADPDFIKAWKKYFPKRKINCGCHQYVMLVLKACGYPTMPLKWNEILVYLRKHFKEIKPNFTQSQLKAGDIRVHKNAKGGYHIWIIVKDGGKFYRAEANQVGNKRYAHINTSNKGNTTKHKADWLFRAK